MRVSRFWEIISGCVGTLSAGFLVGAIFTFLFFALPSKMAGVASLYIMSASIVSYLLGLAFCLIFRLKNLQFFIIPLFGVVGIILLMPFYRCLVLNQCDIFANMFVIYETFGFPFQFVAFIYFISSVTILFVTLIFNWTVNYRDNLKIQKLNLLEEIENKVAC